VSAGVDAIVEELAALQKQVQAAASRYVAGDAATAADLIGCVVVDAKDIEADMLRLAAANTEKAA
jgi:glutathione S-transferase